MDKELVVLMWLEKSNFPRESCFSHNEIALEVPSNLAFFAFAELSNCLLGNFLIHDSFYVYFDSKCR